MIAFAGLRADQIKEEPLLDWILELASLLHVRTAHFRPARTERGYRTAVSGDGKGFPDLVLVGSRGVLWRECKTQVGRLRPEQVAWLEALTTAGQDAKIWRPTDWLDGTVERELREVA